MKHPIALVALLCGTLAACANSPQAVLRSPAGNNKKAPMKHPMPLAERVKADPFERTKPMFGLWDKFGDKAEARIFKVMEECYAVQGKEPDLIRVNTTPENHSNPLVHMLRQLENFSLPIETRDEFYRINYTRDMNDPKQRKEYKISKRQRNTMRNCF